MQGRWRRYVDIGEYRPIGKVVNCPHCAQPNNYCTMNGDFVPPSPKDIVFCFGCGGLSIYTDTLDVRVATAEEELEFGQHPDVVSARRAISYTSSAQLARALMAAWS